MTPIDLLLHLLDGCYVRRAWHGANLKGSIRGLTPEAAAWRVTPARKNIAEHVLHAAYWKYIVRRTLLPDSAPFPLPGHNWFPVAALTPAEWKRTVRLLDGEHRQLAAAVAALPARKLPAPTPRGRGKVTHLMVIHGAAQHDLYHTGQIQLIKRLWAERSA